jgi:hypothetical protein
MLAVCHFSDVFSGKYGRSRIGVRHRRRYVSIWYERDHIGGGYSSGSARNCGRLCGIVRETFLLEEILLEFVPVGRRSLSNS